MRGAAGRRVLQVVLLVGGLFALGFLYGEQAHAADGTAPEAVTVAATMSPGSVRSAIHAAPARSSATGSATVVRPVTEQVVRPVGDLVETVTDGPAGGPSQFPPLPDMPSLPGLPEVPPLPGLPEVPPLPGLPGIPAGVLPIGAAPQQPGGAAPKQPGAAERGHGSEARSAAPAGVAYGPRAHGTESAGSGVRLPQGKDSARTPAHRAPGHPVGELGRHSAVDNGGSRHGEPHAVTLDHRAPLGLVPGVTAAVATDGTRDRHQDIPESPG